MSQPSSIRPSRRERRREETRQRLIEAALALMQQKPFEQVTVEEITELADVAKGTFFTYFPPKSICCTPICATSRMRCTSFWRR